MNWFCGWSWIGLWQGQGGWASVMSVHESYQEYNNKYCYSSSLCLHASTYRTPVETNNPGIGFVLTAISSLKSTRNLRIYTHSLGDSLDFKNLLSLYTCHPEHLCRDHHVPIAVYFVKFYMSKPILTRKGRYERWVLNENVCRVCNVYVVLSSTMMYATLTPIYFLWLHYHECDNNIITTSTNNINSIATQGANFPLQPH